MIMMSLRQSKDPIPILWQRLIFTLDSSQGGMIRTADVNTHTRTGMIHLLMRSVMMSNDIVVASTANTLL